METITIRFCLNKGDGEWPDLSKLPEEQRTTAFLHEHMTLLLADGDLPYPCNSVVIDNGLKRTSSGKGIKVKDGKIVGYPTPIVCFELEVSDEEAEEIDPDEFLRMVWASSYKIQLPGQEPWYWNDLNGYSQVL